MPEHRWLVLRLDAPLMAFGGVTIDHKGVTRTFPALSMLTGLFANALGWRRTDWERHQSLQNRLVFAARHDRENPAGLLTDTQNARLEKSDKGWTTRGVPEGRNGDSYGAPHRRQREYHMDALVMVVLRLAPEDAGQNGLGVEDLAQALDRPARPLFLGRKPCLPAMPLRQQAWVEASTAFAALRHVPTMAERTGSLPALWPLGEGPETGAAVDRVVDLADVRNWRTGLHGGVRKVVEGRITPGTEAA